MSYVNYFIYFFEKLLFYKKNTSTFAAVFEG
jgi:hypothetical protein